MSAVADEIRETIPEEFPEDELRVLLHRAVPQLPSPAQRLARVRERVVRRRRRRTAAASVTVVAAAVAAALTVPGLVRSPGGTTPAAAVPAPTGPSHAPTPVRDPDTDPTPTPTRTAANPPTLDLYRLVDFATLGDLALRLPGDWTHQESAGLGFASTQHLTTEKVTCDQPTDGYCSPLPLRLPRGGVLLVLKPQHSLQIADKVRVREVVATPGLSKSCVLAGGTQEWEALLADEVNSRSDMVVDATVCLARPTAGETAQAKGVLTSAYFR